MITIPVEFDFSSILEKVEYFTAVDSNDIELIILSFQNEEGSQLISIQIDINDDSLSVSTLQPKNMKYYHRVHVSEKWESIIGCQAIWMWTITNQQGYLDAIQFEFRTPLGSNIIQFLGIASSIQSYELRRFC